MSVDYTLIACNSTHAVLRASGETYKPDDEVDSYSTTGKITLQKELKIIVFNFGLQTVFMQDLPCTTTVFDFITKSETQTTLPGHNLSIASCRCGSWVKRFTEMLQIAETTPYNDTHNVVLIIDMPCGSELIDAKAAVDAATKVEKPNLYMILRVLNTDCVMKQIDHDDHRTLCYKRVRMSPSNLDSDGFWDYKFDESGTCFSNIYSQVFGSFKRMAKTCVIPFTIQLPSWTQASASTNKFVHHTTNVSNVTIGVNSNTVKFNIHSDTKQDRWSLSLVVLVKTDTDERIDWKRYSTSSENDEVRTKILEAILHWNSTELIEPTFNMMKETSSLMSTLQVCPDLSSMWHYCIDQGKLRWDNVNSYTEQPPLRKQHGAMLPPPPVLPARSQSNVSPNKSQHHL